jgi:oligoribonuclease NrnB/cAMP/cGMP phosphodiesterase (DHH superfamily)
MKCYHHNDHDGRCAAAIVNRYFSCTGYAPIEFIEMDYKDVVEVQKIKQDELIYIVDFSFKPDVMKEVLKKTTNIVWLDHHKTAFDYDYGREITGKRDVKYAGCELAWRWCYTGKEIPRSVELIGDYDKWALRFEPSCFEFYEGLKTYNTAPESTVWDDLFDDVEMIRTVCERGKLCIKYRDGYCADIRQSYGYQVNWEGYECYAMNAYMMGSKAFGPMFDQFPICIAYIHDGMEFTVSLYSQQDNIDVSSICVKYGGGGHKGAAGFHCTELPFL